MLDLVLKNGRVIDGTGNPWFFGDVGVKNGVIAGIGRLTQKSEQTINVQCCVISPGFIDGHCHSDLMVLNNPRSEIKLRQGVTTEVLGNCGIAVAPFTNENLDLLRSYVEPVLGKTEREWSWDTVGQYMDSLLQARPSENVATYVGHGTLRIAVMGFDDRPASSNELGRMKHLLEEGLRAGAIGLSLGLMYAPGSYTSREELVELCSVLPKYEGLLAAHIRGEGNSLIPSIEEVIWIAERRPPPDQPPQSRREDQLGQRNTRHGSHGGGETPGTRRYLRCLPLYCGIHLFDHTASTVGARRRHLPDVGEATRPGLSKED